MLRRAHRSRSKETCKQQPKPAHTRVKRVTHSRNPAYEDTRGEIASAKRKCYEMPSTCTLGDPSSHDDVFLEALLEVYQHGQDGLGHSRPRLGAWMYVHALDEDKRLVLCNGAHVWIAGV